MKTRRLIIILVTLILIGLLIWIAIRSTQNQSGASPTNLSQASQSSGQTVSDGLPDVGESSPKDAENVLALKRKQFFTAHPWAELLPHFETHFSIYLDDTSEPISATVVLNSKNAAEFASYQTEARNWLTAQSIPLDQITLNFRYKGQ